MTTSRPVLDFYDDPIDTLKMDCSLMIHSGGLGVNLGGRMVTAFRYYPSVAFGSSL